MKGIIAALFVLACLGLIFAALPNSEAKRIRFAARIHAAQGMGNADKCIALHDPVCGRDGCTYGNTCEAFVAGVRVACHQACPCPGRTQPVCPVQPPPIAD